MKKTIKDVQQWAIDMGIYNHSTTRDQLEKLEEEVCELMQECIHDDRSEQFELELGDCLICLINAAALAGTSIDLCLAKAYNKVMQRTGRMENGKFVKDLH